MRYLFQMQPKLRFLMQVECLSRHWFKCLQAPEKPD